MKTRGTYRYRLSGQRLQVAKYESFWRWGLTYFPFGSTVVYP